MGQETTGERLKMQRFNKLIWVTAAVLIVASLYFRSVPITFSVIAGAAVTVVSYQLLFFLVTRLLDTKTRSRPLLVGIAAFKLALLGFVLWWIVVKMSVHIAAFLVGLSTILLAAAVYGLIDIFRSQDA